MKLDEILETLDKTVEEALKQIDRLETVNKEKDKDEDLMDIFEENSPAVYSLFAALERINAFISAGMLFEATEELAEGTVDKGIEVINKCMKRHAKEMDYNYTFELKPVKE